ncbi:DUF4870 domain-containing protein [Mesobacillus zeae]|uniref:DUF4870 domain-containing protein n=1 Tax=Mesobacillus zeae TaxID=1917180 RepID=A0A398B670_9BACI|nr:DUF4870 domain-containing protein [Mesobacillus zeae]RID84944.1 hypothetical protein D1970_11435 [Mesobacillus zeae]
MNTNKLLSGFCYLSFLFGIGVISPLAVWIASKDTEVKGHAKKAFFSQLIPMSGVVLVVYFAWADLALLNSSEEAPYRTLVAIAGTGLITFIAYIWNLVKGLKVLI